MPVFDNLSLISILLMAVQFFIVVSVVIRVILTRHPPGSSFAWILLTVVLPYVGFFLYLMLGERPSVVCVHGFYATQHITGAGCLRSEALR